MYSKSRIVWNLIETGIYNRSKVAELVGIPVNEVYQILKDNPVLEYGDDEIKDESFNEEEYGD